MFLKINWIVFSLIFTSLGCSNDAQDTKFYEFEGTVADCVELNQWQNAVSIGVKNCKYTISFPNEPDYKYFEEISTVFGKTKVWLVMYNDTVSNNTYSIKCTEFDNDSLKDLPTKEILKIAFKNFCTQNMMELQSMDTVKHQNFIAFKYMLSGEEDLITKMDIWSGKLLYEVGVISNLSTPSKDYDCFESSLNIIP